MRTQQTKGLQHKRSPRIFVWLMAGMAVSMIFWMTACHNEFPSAVMSALQKAGANRESLEKMLRHYKHCGNDEKYKAACFLVSGMPYHQQNCHIRSYDKRLDSLCQSSMAAYYTLTKDATVAEMENSPLRQTLLDSAQAAGSRATAINFSSPQVEAAMRPDIETLSGEFIAAHIEHVFMLRKTVERIRKLSFSDFCEYVLPYRAMGNYPVVLPSGKFRDDYNRFMRADSSTDITESIARYNQAMWWIRRWNGQFPFDVPLGYPDLCFNGFQDCVDVANYGAQIFRACGIPAAVEFNVAYKVLDTRHFTVAVMDDEGRWMSFSPESELPSHDHSRLAPALNIMRLHFGPQRNNPAALAQGEPLPEVLSDPCIEDVSHLYLDVGSLTIDIEKRIPRSRRLAYLASFQPGCGLVAVTWGKVSHFGRKVKFQQVVKDHIYFPVYCDDMGRLVPFAAPFVVRSSDNEDGIKVERLLHPSGKYIATTLHRKYPRKPHLERKAQTVPGTVVLGADTKDFSHPDTLGVITQVPKAEWTDLSLSISRPYRYYRVQATQANPHLFLAELQFLTERSRGYANVVEPVSLHGNIAPALHEKWVRLLDEPLEKCGWKAEYDGNVQTAPDAYPNVTFRLESPQWVDRLRYMVKHADNGISPGDTYALYRWTDEGWKEVWRKQAVSNSLPAGKLEIGALYWLANTSRGREELPFVITADGRQEFPHASRLNLLDKNHN